MAAIALRIHEIVQILLPVGYLPIQLTVSGADPASPTSLSGNLTHPAAMTTASTDPRSRILANAPSTPSRMKGPACALLILVQNSKCCLPSLGDAETDVVHCSRSAAGSYAPDDAIREFEAIISVRNAYERDRHTAMALDSKPE